MTLTNLSIRDFRCFEETNIEPDPGALTVLHGPNGSGKTSVLEAVGWLSTMRSLRGASRETVIRRGADRAILRAETSVAKRSGLIEVEICAERPGRAQLNRNVVRRRTELAEALRVSVFSPADRRIVDGRPAERREYLDDVLIERHPRLEALVDDVGQILRQRTALLRQGGPRPDENLLSTLDVWDQRLAHSGTELATAREELACELEPLVNEAHGQLAGADEPPVVLVYRRSWSGELLEALAATRTDDLRRQTTSVGPHRDELEIALGSAPARTHASQGEQRSIALALRLATHVLRSRSAPEPPVLLLDDVFSELDPRRSAALVEMLPSGQVLLTTASYPPPSVAPDRILEMTDESSAYSTGRL